MDKLVGQSILTAKQFNREQVDGLIKVAQYMRQVRLLVQICSFLLFALSCLEYATLFY
jgi:hypothetical protein